MGEGRDRVVAELGELTRRRDELASERAARDPVGDGGDQADSLEQSDDLSLIEDRITDLTRWLDGASTSDDTLPDGTEVTLRYPDSSVARMRVVAIAAEIDTSDDAVETLTANSPLGLALVGRGAGDTIRYDTPQGSRQAEVVTIDPPS